MKDFNDYINKYPHNSDCGDKFALLVELCFSRDNRGLSLEDFLQDCLCKYGGSLAGALIDYLNNKL